MEWVSVTICGVAHRVAKAVADANGLHDGFSSDDEAWLDRITDANRMYIQARSDRLIDGAMRAIQERKRQETIMTNSVPADELALINDIAKLICPQSWDDRPHLQVRDGQPVRVNGELVIDEAMTAYARAANVSNRDRARDIAIDILALIRERDANRREDGAAPG